MRRKVEAAKLVWVTVPEAVKMNKTPCGSCNPKDLRVQISPATLRLLQINVPESLQMFEVNMAQVIRAGEILRPVLANDWDPAFDLPVFYEFVLRRLEFNHWAGREPLARYYYAESFADEELSAGWPGHHI